MYCNPYIPSSGKKTKGSIVLEGTLSDQDVMIGSNINLTCKVTSPSCAHMWLKNSNRFPETGRVKWLQGKEIIPGQCSVSKLFIQNFTSSDVGKYECLVMDVISETQKQHEKPSIIIHAGK